MSISHKYEWEIAIATDDSLDGNMRLFSEIYGRRTGTEKMAHSVAFASIFREEDNKLSIVFWNLGPKEPPWVIDYNELMEQIKKAASMI